MGRSENGSLLGVAGKPSPCLAYFPRCPYTVGMRLCNVKDSSVRMLKKIHPESCLGLVSKTASAWNERRVVVIHGSL